MNKQRIQRKLTELRSEQLIKELTPVYPLQHFSSFHGKSQVIAKREDLTASIYGGNKVRNLEYIFSDARRNDKSNLVTAAPRGSNFVAALAAQAPKAGFDFTIHEFTPQRSNLIDAQSSFSTDKGGHFYNYPGPACLSAPLAYLTAKITGRIDSKSYFIQSGGSSVIGALGHVNAVFELSEQMKNAQKIPDYLVVGAGTCGTIAGLLAGIKLTGLRTKIVGIRCVDKIICNKYNIIKLANRILKFLNANLKVTSSDFNLIDPPGASSYGKVHIHALDAINRMIQLEGIRLDTTYTSKVILKLEQLITDNQFKDRFILYWHTFSDLGLKKYSQKEGALPC